MSSKIDRAIQGNLLLPKGYGQTQKTKPLLKPGEERAVAGFDIEADSITAEPFLLGYSTDHKDSFEIFSSAMSVIDFHTKFSFREPINFYYNLQYDFEGMLKLFDKDVAILLYGMTSAFLDENCRALTKEIMDSQKMTWAYKTSYIPKKAFHIKIAGDKKYSYFDALQYFQMGLNKASEKYLPSNQKKDDFKAAYTSKPLFELKSTPELETIRFKRHILHNNFFTKEEKESKIKEMTEFFSRFTDAKHYRETIIKYCVQDASLCRQLGHIIVNGVNTFVNTRNFNSSASISEYYFRSNGVGVPKLAPSVYKEFMKPYYGGRFESMKKGFFKGVSIYDIKSAYPDAMKDMPILSQKPIIRNSYSLHDEALYGTYKINIDIPEDYYISPLQIRSGLLYFPTGKYREYYVDKITLTKLLDEGHDIELLSAMEIYDDNARPLLYDLIIKLFNIKEDGKQPEVVRLAAKIILNSLYGKFIQLVDDAGLEIINDILELDTVSPAELFNIANRYYKRVHSMDFKTGKLYAPQYASYITAHARMKLYETAKKINVRNVIGFHTDSIMLHNAEITTGHNIGAWELEQLKKIDPVTKEVTKKVPVVDANMFFLKTGFYEVEKEGLKKLRSRGVGSTPSLLKKDFIVKRRLGLRQAVKKNFELMNIISETPIQNNVDKDEKRIWNESISLEDIINGKMVDSMPRIIDAEALVIEKQAKQERKQKQKTYIHKAKPTNTQPIKPMELPF
jgi:hypothetical protein